MPSGWCGCWWPVSCTAVAVPSVEEEALRDLVRAREDLRGDLMRARHRAGEAAAASRGSLRRAAGQLDPGASRVAGRRRLDQPASQRAFEDYRGAVDALMIRREQLEPEIAERCPTRRGRRPRAVDVPARDRHADRRRAVRGDRRLRPVPAPRAGDELSRRGAVRALLRRAAAARPDHQVRQPARPPAARRGRLALPPRRPGSAGSLARRQTDGEPEIVALSWKAQRRLHHVWQRMEQRGKRRTIIAVAAARELAGFCWAVATTD